jgi:hypothetical protein
LRLKPFIAEGKGCKREELGSFFEQILTAEIAEFLREIAESRVVGFVLTLMLVGGVAFLCELCAVSRRTLRLKSFCRVRD